MKVWVLVLFLAGDATEAPGTFDTKEACIASGTEQVAKFREHHKHSTGWFWCVEGTKN